MTTDSEKTSEKTLIVVLGMHRSGTSVLARAMQAVGGELGERLMPPVAGVNDKGFFEDVDVHAINEELLQSIGLDWYSMTPIRMDCIDPSVLDRLQTKAITVLREKCTDMQTFVLKDPRLTRLVPFWRAVFACLNMRVFYVVAVRSPISVVKSLAKVHHFAEEKSYILWLAHEVAAIEDTRNEKRVFVDYDRLMDAPARELLRVSEAAGLPLHENSVEVFAKEFLDNGLRNTRFSADDLDVVRSAPPQIKTVFSAMQRAAAEEIEAYGPELDAAAAEGKRYLESIAPLLRYEWQLVQHVEKVTPALSEAHSRIEKLEEALRSNEQHGANLLGAIEARAAAEIAARDQVIIGLQNPVAETQQTIQGHLDHLEASQRYANDLKARSEHFAAVIDELTAQRESDQRARETLESKMVSQEADVKRANEFVANVLGSTSWRITAPLRALRRGDPSRAG